MKKRTRQLDIPQKVKKIVWERDNHKCILCGSYQAMPNAHFLPRSHSGMGIEQNIVTLCHNCHFKTDNTTDRLEYLEMIRVYLTSKYPSYKESYELAYLSMLNHSNHFLKLMDKDKQLYYEKKF